MQCVTDRRLKSISFHAFDLKSYVCHSDGRPLLWQWLAWRGLLLYEIYLDKLEASRPYDRTGKEVAIDDRLFQGLKHHPSGSGGSDQYCQISDQLRIQNQSHLAVPAGNTSPFNLPHSVTLASVLSFKNGDSWGWVWHAILQTLSEALYLDIIAVPCPDSFLPCSCLWPRSDKADTPFTQVSGMESITPSNYLYRQLLDSIGPPRSWEGSTVRPVIKITLCLLT